mgnify:CR=1 FL=1
MCFSNVFSLAPEINDFFRCLRLWNFSTGGKATEDWSTFLKTGPPKDSTVHVYIYMYAYAVKIKKRSLQIKRSLQTKKDLKESLVIKYPKSGINGLWEERSRWTYLDSLFP